MNGILSSLLASGVVLAIICGCGQNEPRTSPITSSIVRADRRAYDGAPPVIPHKPLGAACTTCHTSTGMQIPNHGFAPANPHLGTSFAAATENCRQCHLFETTKTVFAESEYEPLRQDLSPGDRLYPGAPPVIPHQILIRENCQACHVGPAARPEIRCTHPQRTNCVQCHVNQDSQVAGTWPKIDAAVHTTELHEK